MMQSIFSDAYLQGIEDQWSNVDYSPHQDLDDCADPIWEGQNLSLDLEEATYRMPHDILDLNVQFIEKKFKEYRPWKVFRDLFTVFDRKVDMTNLIKKGYWDGEEQVIARNGSFMGDVMSFIHLSLYLRATTIYSSGGRWPIGQSVGDDLIALGISPIFVKRFCDQLQATGGKTSKLNSSSSDSITFCESYAVKPIDDQIDLVGYPTGSRFGDFFFLDTIKGSLLTGKSKVDMTGSNPFFGHSRMLNKQLAWHPIKWVKERAKLFLWDANYFAARKLSSGLASLPKELGGLDMAVGPQVNFEDEVFQEKFLPYYCSIATVSDDKVFLAFYTLLQGIYKSNPKGLPYENDLEVIEEILSNLKCERIQNMDALVPRYLINKGMVAKLRFVRNEFGLTGVSWLVDEVCRRQSYLKYWNQVKNDSFLSLPLKAPYERWRRCWAEIRRNFDGRKCPPTVTSIKSLVSYSAIGFGIFISTGMILL